ncbi:type II toxin-antitoxin system VapB family antitoxin [Thermodesulfobacteriota bacterium]
MRTTIIIQDEKMERLLTVTGKRKKSEAVNLAIDDFLHRCAVRRLLDLRGKMNLEDNWKQIRELELDE